MALARGAVVPPPPPAPDPTAADVYRNAIKADRYIDPRFIEDDRCKLFYAMQEFLNIPAPNLDTSQKLE